MSTEKSTTSENERFYDVQVAPLLEQIAKDCMARGIHLCATVEYQLGERGLTLGVNGNPSFGFQLVRAAAEARGNIDTLMFAVIRYAAEHGHSSVILHQLGVPRTPEGVGATH